MSQLMSFGVGFVAGAWGMVLFAWGLIGQIRRHEERRQLELWRRWLGR